MWSSGSHFVQRGGTFCNFGKGHNEEQFSELDSNLGQWFRRRCHLKDFLTGVLWPFCSVERNHLYNFGIGHYEEQFCEIILNLDQWSGGNIIKILFLSRALVAPLLGGAKPFECAIFVEGIMRNNSVK